ncbi:PPOX class F420-dependent oxidoreductase [Streptomyces meridianus]|uniref:PPOX class F420-dependent oxidoreductase n=1 Tax=Streptomyces meridianus TaxID=2938945 RepID=A0ABT0XC12_9ACTN|nr:PPOX class F420-dependent oxidoreductase [Streptomyces meridianus]MCM2579959.1 PPOX class F420-dependent oxidoreductase [Streptomyces meridianus]
MTQDEWRAFLLAGTRTGKVAVNRRNGRPHVTPVWFTLDDVPAGGRHDRLLFTTWHGSVKGRALIRSPYFSLCVDDETPPFSFVLLECSAELVDDPEELQTWAVRIGSRYMGPEQGESYGRRNAVPGELLVRADIERVTAVQAIADWPG